MLLGDFLNTLATQAGIPAEDATLKAVLSNTNVSGYEISDEIVNKINASHFTMDAAKNNSDLNKYFKATILNGLDTELEKTYNELGLTDDMKAKLKAEPSSFKRASLLAKEVKALEAEKAGAKGGDKAALEQQIRDLNAQILSEKESVQSEVSKVKDTYESRLKNMLLKAELSGFDYDKSKPLEANLVLANHYFEKELSDKKLRVVNDNDKLFLETEAGTRYYDNNKEVALKDFASKVFAQHNLLATSNQPTAEQKTITTSKGASGRNSFAAAAQEVAQQFETSNT